MQRRKSKERDFRCNGEENPTTLAGFLAQSVILLLLFTSCSVFQKQRLSKKPYCHSGEGIFRLKIDNETTTFRFSSLVQKNKWKIGLSFPLVGEIPFIVSKDFDWGNNRQLLDLVGGSEYKHKLEDIEEINSLFFQFFLESSTKAEINKSYYSGHYRLEVQNKKSKTFSKHHEQYSLRLVRSILFVSWTIFNLDILYSDCFYAEQY